MHDMVVLLVSIAAVVVLLAIVQSWLRHAPDLFWMSALCPFSVITSFLLCSLVTYVLSEGLFARGGLPRAGLPCTRLVLILLIAPWPTRRLADLLAWCLDGGPRTGLSPRCYAFDSTRRDQQRKFIAATLDEV